MVKKEIVHKLYELKYLLWLQLNVCVRMFTFVASVIDGMITIAQSLVLFQSAMTSQICWERSRQL